MHVIIEFRELVVFLAAFAGVCVDTDTVGARQLNCDAGSFSRETVAGADAPAVNALNETFRPIIDIFNFGVLIGSQAGGISEPRSCYISAIATP